MINIKWFWLCLKNETLLKLDKTKCKGDEMNWWFGAYKVINLDSYSVFYSWSFESYAMTHSQLNAYEIGTWRKKKTTKFII